MRCPDRRRRADRAHPGAELRRRAVDCLLIDALAEPQQWDQATVVHPRSLEVFEALGIVDRFIVAGAPQRAARLHSGGKVLVELDFSLSGAPYPYNLGLSEEDTERFLTEYLEAAGGQVERSTRLLAMSQDADGVTATVERGGREEEVRAGWIVGCGGYHSPVRDAVGIELEGHDIEDPWAVFDVTLGGRTDDFETTLVYLEETMVILTPLPGRRFRVYTRPRGDEDDFVAAAAAVLALYEPDTEFVDIENPTRFRCHAKVASRYREGRALLAGDAAHVCSPDQGHGMNSGIQDAVNLAWKLALVTEGDADPALLDSYEAERRPVALEVVAAGEEMEEMGRFDGAKGRARRDAEVRAAFALATAPDEAPVGTIHPQAAATLGVKSLAVLAIRPDRHVGFIAEGATLADVEAYAALVTGA